MFLVLLFSYTGLSKLLEHARFVFQMQFSPMGVIRNFSIILSWIVPILEIAIAGILTVGIFAQQFIKKGLWLSLILISSFELYITLMLLSGKNLPCACGGIISLLSWKGHELFNGVTIVLIVLALFDFTYRRKSKTKEKYLRA